MGDNSSPRVPLDVQLLILDEINDVPLRQSAKYHILRSSALTCQAWLPRARYYLYNAIHLHRPAQLPLLSRTLTENPIIGPLIKTLDLACLARRSSWGLYMKDRPANIPFTPEAVATLSSLRSLAFKVVRNDRTPAYFPDLVRSFTVLDGLEKVSLQHVGLMNIVHLIWSFPALKSLYMIECHFEDPAGPLPEPSAYPDRFRTLRTLEIRDVYCTPDYHFRNFAAAGQITSLTLWIITNSYDDAFSVLRHYSQLEVLDLAFSGGDLTCVEEALSHVRSDKLRLLSVNLRPHIRTRTSPLDSLHPVSDFELDAILSAAPFLGLEMFELKGTCRTPSVLEDTRITIICLLPRCYERGILKLDIRPCKL